MEMPLSGAQAGFEDGTNQNVTFAAGKPVAAVCHGTQLLAAANTLEGYRVTSYPACAAQCRLAGADWQPEPVIKDKNLVTAQAWPNHPRLRAYIELLGAKINISGCIKTNLISTIG